MTPEGLELLEVKEPIGYIVTISFSHSDKVAICFGGCFLVTKRTLIHNNLAVLSSS